MECLGLHNKPKAEVHPGHKLTGPQEDEEEEEAEEEGQRGIRDACFILRKRTPLPASSMGLSLPYLDRRCGVD
jgi:hypothetical protein